MAGNIIDILIKAKDMASGAFKDVGNAMKKLGDNTSKVEKGTESFSDSWEMMVTGINQGIHVIQRIGQVIQAAFDYTYAGAQVVQTKKAFASLMDTIDVGTDVLDDWRESVGGTVSDMELMTGFQTLAAGTSKELTKAFSDNNAALLEISKAASALNPHLGDTAFMYESITRGIKRNSPFILDNLGIVVKVGEAHEKLAAELGKTVDELTAEEKQMALLNDVLDKGDILVNQLGGSVESAVDPWDKFTAAVKNAKDEMAEAHIQSGLLGDALVFVADALDDGRKGASEYKNNMELLTWAVDNAVISQEDFKRLTGGVWQEDYITTIQDIIKLYEEWKNKQNDVNYAIETGIPFIEDYTVTMYDAAAAAKEMSDNNKELLSLAESLTAMHEKYGEDMLGIEEKINAVNAELMELYNQQNLTTEQKEKIAELESEYGDLLGSIDAVQLKHRDATNAMIYDLLAQKLAADGLTDAELTLLFHIGEDLGVLEDGAGDVAAALSTMLDGVLEDGDLTKDELSDVEDLINSMYETSVPNAQGVLDSMLTNIKADGEVTKDELQDIYDITGKLYNDAGARQEALDKILDGIAADAADGSLDITNIQTILNELDGKTFETTLIVNTVENGGSVPDPTKAAGGMIRAASGYWVGEVGPEPFFPATDGRILSNSQAKDAMRSGGRMGGEVINVHIHTAVNLANRAFVEQELAPMIRDVLRKERR